MNVVPARIIILVWALSGLGLAPALAGGKVWVGLYLAKNAPPPPGAQVAPEDLSGQLRDVFGFNHYQLLKSGEIELGHEWEQWVIPRNDFFIRLLPLHHESGEPKIVDYEIYEDGFIVAHGRFEPYDGFPLFINGPDYHHGRLIFVLDAR
jgi:hypothetical protein